MKKRDLAGFEQVLITLSRPPKPPEGKNLPKSPEGRGEGVFVPKLFTYGSSGRPGREKNTKNPLPPQKQCVAQEGVKLNQTMGKNNIKNTRGLFQRRKPEVKPPSWVPQKHTLGVGVPTRKSLAPGNLIKKDRTGCEIGANVGVASKNLATNWGTIKRERQPAPRPALEEWPRSDAPPSKKIRVAKEGGKDGSRSKNKKFKNFRDGGGWQKDPGKQKGGQLGLFPPGKKKRWGFLKCPT